MLIDGGSEICVMHEWITRELNIRWKRANWKLITANGNGSDLPKVAESVPVHVDGIVIPVPVFLAISGSEEVILGRHWETYTRKCERNLNAGSCEISIPAVDESVQVTFVAIFQRESGNRLVSSLGKLYA